MGTSWLGDVLTGVALMLGWDKLHRQGGPMRKGML